MASKKDIYWHVENMIPRPPVDDEPNPDIRGAIVFLPGRGNYGYGMHRDYCEVFNWSGVGLVSVTPKLHVGWYPPPSGPHDQEDAVSGLDSSSHDINMIVDRLWDQFSIPRERIVLVGFSMGAVAAVYWAIHTDAPVAAVVCHSGAVLEPWKVGAASHNMPIILNHAQDDFCFGWDERYLPMRTSLMKRGYNVVRAERASGNHTILPCDVRCLKRTFEEVFGDDLAWQPLWKTES